MQIKLNFSLTGKCFSLTNFFNGKQTQENLKNGFSKTTFQKTNITYNNNNNRDIAYHKYNRSNQKIKAGLN
jgi:hypothetical protein